MLSTTCSPGDIAAMRKRVADLERENKRAGQRADRHSRRLDKLRAMIDEELNKARCQLITFAETAWDGWGHLLRSEAVYEYLRIEAVLFRRRIEANKAAGRDPYGSEDNVTQAEGSKLELAAWDRQDYKFRSPLWAWVDLADAKGELKKALAQA